MHAVRQMVGVGSVVVALVAAAPSCGGVTGINTKDGISVLFIGNSLTYTNDLPGVLQALIATTGTAVEVASVAEPGFGLEDHWATGVALDAIRRGGWDVVVLQQGPSATEGRASLIEYSSRFAVEISGVGARTALYMVWPEEDRSFDFAGVSDAYATAAREVQGLLFPAGEAWREAWRRDGSIELYGPDRFHPNAAGTYVAALVMFQQLTGRTPVGLPARLESMGGQVVNLSEEVARTLQEAAVTANGRFALP